MILSRSNHNEKKLTSSDELSAKKIADYIHRKTGAQNGAGGPLDPVGETVERSPHSSPEVAVS